LTSGAVARLKELVKAGELPVGARLPSERELSARFGLSRVTVRRAVQRLRDDGVVDSRRGAGNYVADAEAKGRSQTVSFMSGADSITFTQIQDMALRKGYLLSVYSQCRSSWEPELERSFLEAVMRGRHRGLLAFCSPLRPTSDALLAEVEASGVKVVHIDHYSVEPPAQSYILPDLRRAGHMAVVRLLMAGHRRVVFATPGLDVPPPYLSLLEAGAREAFAEHGAVLGAEFLVVPHPSSGTWGESPRGAGFVATSLEMGRRLCRAGAEGVVGVRLSGDTRVEPDFDFLDFDYSGIYAKALGAIIDGPPGPVRELVMPRLVIIKHGAEASDEN